MAIIYELDASEFSSLFDQYNRGDNFTHTARYALFDYLEELSDDIGEPIKTDILSLCCDWTEYEPEELLQAYDHLCDLSETSEEEQIEALVSELKDNTTIIELHNGCFLVQDF